MNLKFTPQLLFVACITLFLTACNAPKKELPVIGEWTVEKTTVDGVEQIDSISFKVPPFSFTDQHGNTFSSEKNLDGKIYAAYFFFTSCPSMCYQMSKQMSRIHEMTHSVKNFEIITITVDPERDNPKRLLDYAHRFEANTNKWHFLTGVADTIYDLGWNGMLVGMGKDDESPGGFIHSERFILIDKEKQIRGFYDGTNSAEVAKMYDAIIDLSESYEK